MGDILQCTFSYMPYRSGDYPAGFRGETVDRLHALVALARENLTQTSVSIRITDPLLTVDDMNNALQQVGGGYLLCQLNRDGTAVTFAPQNNMTREACLARLVEIDRLADELLASCISDDMTACEKALRFILPSQTECNITGSTIPICGLCCMIRRRHMARYPIIWLSAAAMRRPYRYCLKKQGFPTVQGRMRSENHMWNIAQIDGEWAYHDATSDRGMSKFGFVHFGVSADEMQDYVWDREYVKRLTDCW
ncbi:MAG TPA: hypothetical protein H9845_08660 [Candidatus Agathobaculum pullicola]|nr:hypothetical protein [Candidatus Agathobaculum pullicola]